MTEQFKPGSLQGLKVVDASRVLAGPFCAQILGDHGADVIKVEAPDGDECRDFGPPFVNGSSAYFNAVNRNKRAICLDLNTDEDRTYFFGLVKQADVLIENFKLSTLKKWGINSIEEFTSMNSKLVHCRITGFGDAGPLGGMPGYDAAVQAIAGLISINGDEGQDGVRIGVPIVDLTTGMNASISVLLALNARWLHGKGQLVDVSLYDTAVSVAHPFLSNYLHSGNVPAPLGNGHGNIVPYNTFKTSTVPLFIAAANNRLFKKLCDLISLHDLPQDSRFLTNSLRVKNRVALESELSDALLHREGEELGQRLLSSGVPAAPILDIGAVADSAHTKYRQMVVDTESYRGPGIPIKLKSNPGSIRRSAPEQGEYEPASSSTAFFSESFDRSSS